LGWEALYTCSAMPPPVGKFDGIFSLSLSAFSSDS
jgi:hypothetical protein